MRRPLRALPVYEHRLSSAFLTRACKMSLWSMFTVVLVLPQLVMPMDTKKLRRKLLAFLKNHCRR